MGDDAKSKDKDFVSRYMRNQQFSREQEYAADRVGLTQFFKDSPYSFEILDGIYDVLLYSDLPFDEIPFQRSEVEADFYQFPDNYFLKTVATIADRSNMLDTLLTHPNIEKRRALAKGLIRSFSNEERKTFVQPKEQFTRLRNAAGSPVSNATSSTTTTTKPYIIYMSCSRPSLTTPTSTVQPSRPITALRSTKGWGKRT